MPGDSGSVIVNEANEVVALHIAGDKLPNRGKGLELPIEVVLSLFQSQDSIPVEFATTTATGIVNIVPGGAQVAIPAELTRGLTGEQAAHPVLVPATAPWLPGVELPTAQSLGGLQEDLDRSAAGRALITLWLAHHRELIDLIEGNRRVALAWHRNGGPALLQMFVRMTGRAQLRLPPTLDGRPLDGCLDRIHDAFARFASPRLRADLDQARATLPDLGGLTYPQMINALGD
jgi:hypothetical protein